jgi:hypothetical protein
MFRDYTLMLNGVVIPNIRSVTVTVEGPAERTNVNPAKKVAATIEVERDATEHPVLDVFGFTTNENGSPFIFSGESTIEFVRDDYRVTYMFEIKKAFIEKWTLTNPSSPSEPTMEKFTIRAGHLIYSIEGSPPEEYVVPAFHEVTESS